MNAKPLPAMALQFRNEGSFELRATDPLVDGRDMTKSLPSSIGRPTLSRALTPVHDQVVIAKLLATEERYPSHRRCLPLLRTHLS